MRKRLAFLVPTALVLGAAALFIPRDSSPSPPLPAEVIPITPVIIQLTPVPEFPQTTPARTPLVPGGSWVLMPISQTGSLYAITARAADDIWAVGDSGGSARSSLVIHWDGENWSAVAVPMGESKQTGLSAVLAPAANNVWVAGGTTLLHWDGATWQTPAVPQVSQPMYQALAGSGPDDIWVAGTQGGRDQPRPLLLHWNGNQWQNTPINSKGTIVSMAEVAPNDIWAVGYHYRGSGGTLILHGDGKSWSETGDQFTGDGYLRLQKALAFQSGDVWIAGGTATMANCDHSVPYTSHWDRAIWVQTTPPLEPGCIGIVFYGLAGLSTSDLWAVGHQELGPVLSHWDGTRWTTLTLPGAEPPDSAWITGPLRSVTMLRTGEVWAVGEQNISDPQTGGIGSFTRPYILHYIPVGR